MLWPALRTRVPDPPLNFSVTYPATKTTLLLERDAEIDLGQALLASTRAGNGGLLSFEGPPGIGKTRLLEDLKERAVAERMTVLTATGEDLTQTDDPMKKAMRQIAGVFAELEKARLVSKLRAARDRKRALTGKCGGRKSHAEARPQTVALAKRLYRRNPVTGRRRSLRQIAAALAAADHVNERGAPFNPASIRSMVNG